MSASEQDNGAAAPEVAGDGVLSKLPRTRPQRSSPRRAGARRSGAAKAATAPAAPEARKPAKKASAKATGAGAAAGSQSPRRGSAKPASGKPAAIKPAAAGRRAAAKRAAGATAGAEKRGTPAGTGAGAADGAPSAGSPRRPKATRSSAAGQRVRSAPRRSPGEEEAVPRQGWASDGERMTGPVEPPSGSDLLGSALEIAGEAARAGLAGGERLLRDLFKNLPGA